MKKTAASGSVSSRKNRRKKSAPDEWELIHGTFYSPDSSIVGAGLKLDKKDWPQPSAVEVAQIACHIPGASDDQRAKRAVSLIWAGAVAAKEALEAAEKFKRELNEHFERRAEMFGVDPRTLKYPLSYAEFLELLDLGPVKVGQRKGVQGRELWREFLRREFLARRMTAGEPLASGGFSTVEEYVPVTDAAVGEWEAQHEREGIKNSALFIVCASRFVCWRAELVRENRLNPAFREKIGSPKEKS